MENSSDDFSNVWVEFPDSCNGLYQVYIYILWISLIEFVAHKWAGAHIYTQGPYNAKLWLPWRPHRRSSSHATVWLLERRKSLKEREFLLLIWKTTLGLSRDLPQNIHTPLVHTNKELIFDETCQKYYTCLQLLFLDYNNVPSHASHCCCKNVSKNQQKWLLTMLQSWAKS